MRINKGRPLFIYVIDVTLHFQNSVNHNLPENY